MSELHDPTAGPNRDQARYWTEEGGPSWVRNEHRYEEMLAPFDDALLAEIAPGTGDHILDIGCGFGTTSIAAASRGASVTAVDISTPMIERARERAGIAGVAVEFLHRDAQEDALGGPFDIVMSRFGVMFFIDPNRAFTNIASSTRADGRLAFMCWQTLDRNPWLSLPIDVVRSFDPDAVSAPSSAASAPTSTGVAGAPNPLAFADRNFTTAMLESAGWTDIDFTAVEPLRAVGGDEGIDGAVEFSLNGSSVKVLLERGGPELRADVVAALAERFDEYLVDGRVMMESAAWLVTARRR